MSLAVTPTTVAISTSVNPGDGTHITGSSLAQLAATGGTGAITWQMAGGALPPGVNLSSDGRLTGTAQARGAAIVTVRATDSSTPPLFADGVVTVTVS